MMDLKNINNNIISNRWKERCEKLPDEIKEKLNEIFEISLNDSDLLTRPSIYIDKLKDKDKMRSFLYYFKELVKGLKASPNN